MSLNQRKITKTGAKAVTETQTSEFSAHKEQNKEGARRPKPSAMAQLKIPPACWISFLPQKVKIQSYSNAFLTDSE